jgi:hypothetical protein
MESVFQEHANWPAAAWQDPFRDNMFMADSTSGSAAARFPAGHRHMAQHNDVSHPLRWPVSGLAEATRAAFPKAGNLQWL